MTPGPLVFARYAFRPNELGFCGGDDDRALFAYATSGTVDGGLLDLERRFEGAYPYLQLIARANGIDDPLDGRVVEAYWVGNDLLDRVDMGMLLASVTERFKPRTSPAEWPWLASKVPAGARPHHSFHVFEVYPRAGFMKSGSVGTRLLETAEQCRVRWGRVRSVEGAQVVADIRPLELRSGVLGLGAPRPERVARWVDGRGFVDDIEPGDWVSVHWGWACDRLSARQAGRLAHYTRHQLALFNTTL